MTFFGEKRNKTLFDQQAYLRNNQQKLKKRKQLTRLVLLSLLGVILGVVLLNIIFRLPSLYSNVTQPFEKLQGEFYSQSNLDLGKRTNILLLTSDYSQLTEVALASFEPGNRKVTVLKLSPETTVLSQEGGKKLSDLPVFQQGRVVNIDQLSTAVMEVVGYIPDSYIVVADSRPWINTETLNQVVENSSLSPSLFFKLRSYKSYLDDRLKTNLTINELFSLGSKVKGIPPERFELIETLTYTTESGLIDSQTLANEIGVKLNDRAVVEANLAVEIVNQSGVDGLGQVFKGIVSNLGANVVSVDSAEVANEKSQVLVAGQSNYLTQRLARLLQAEIKEEQEIGSVDLQVKVGKNMAKFFDY